MHGAFLMWAVSVALMLMPASWRAWVEDVPAFAVFGDQLPETWCGAAYYLVWPDGKTEPVNVQVKVDEHCAESVVATALHEYLHVLCLRVHMTGSHGCVWDYEEALGVPSSRGRIGEAPAVLVVGSTLNPGGPDEGGTGRCGGIGGSDDVPEAGERGVDHVGHGASLDPGGCGYVRCGPVVVDEGRDLRSEGPGDGGTGPVLCRVGG